MENSKLNFSDLTHLVIEHPLLTIRPYQDSDFSGLSEIFDREFFTWFFTDYASCADFVAEKMNEVAKGDFVMYVLIDNQTNKIIGTSSLLEISLRHRRLEMGSSWLAKKYHGSHYNALAKYLFIEALIEKLGFLRIQWKTDALNQKSQVAMRKLGFVNEGTLHRHAITYSGRVRDSVIFAVTDISWNEVRQIIQQRIKDKAKITTSLANELTN
jgi:RimJ/RimL family protein N-acetyltransferase